MDTWMVTFRGDVTGRSYQYLKADTCTQLDNGGLRFTRRDNSKIWLFAPGTWLMVQGEENRPNEEEDKNS